MYKSLREVDQTNTEIINVSYINKQSKKLKRVAEYTSLWAVTKIDILIKTIQKE